MRCVRLSWLSVVGTVMGVELFSGWRDISSLVCSGVCQDVSTAQFVLLDGVSLICVSGIGTRLSNDVLCQGRGTV